MKHFIFGALLFVVSCKAPSEPPLSDQKVENLHAEIQSLVGLQKFKHEDHLKLKKYFFELINRTQFTPEDCNRIGLTASEYDQIMSACQQSGYFVCAEEVRLYGERNICKQ